jgi:hypothetical protein
LASEVGIGLDGLAEEMACADGGDAVLMIDRIGDGGFAAGWWAEEEHGGSLRYHGFEYT